MFGHLLFSREAWYAAIKDFIWARSSELSLSQQNVKGGLKEQENYFDQDHALPNLI